MIRAFLKTKIKAKLVDKKIAELLNDMADAFVGQTKSNLKKKKDIHGNRFVPLKESTIKAKKKKGSSFPRTPLIDSGAMRKVYRSKDASASSLESRVAVAEKRKEVAKFHNDGGDNLPQREWFGIGPKTERRLNKMIRAQIKKIVRFEK
jgi:phage gpG-like protein